MNIIHATPTLKHAHSLRKHYKTLQSRITQCVGIGVYEATCGYIDVPAWMTAGGFNPYSCKWATTSYNKMSDRFKIRMDKDVAWRTFSTFDYYFSSDDVLADKELFDVICNMLEENGLHRDQDNPDVVFTLIKDANQSIDYTYVPETREQIQTGSTSTPIYGYKGAYLCTYRLRRI